MIDIVSKERRSQLMAGIRSKNTRPEMVLRKGLHALGFRYRVHAPNLPGRPDIVLPKYQAVINVHGCFWHGHNCPLFKVPGTNTDFWIEKIQSNIDRDALNNALLKDLGWRTLTVWECTIRQLQAEKLVSKIADWLTSEHPGGEIRGNVDELVVVSHTGNIPASGRHQAVRKTPSEQ
jgi:DNA mismatch endonuclease (patch repair protein)